MSKRALVLALAASSALLPALASADGVAIDHRTVGCIVAGKLPRLNACFAPASSLARARVYFRVADATPDWYYVEMKSDAPCHAGVLPKPKSELIGKRVQYYVDAVDRGFAQSRTPEAEAVVVRNESECEGKPLAPLGSAAMAVFPAMPAGFAGAGIGTTAVLAAVGGAAVVGGGVAIAGGGGGGSATPTTTTTPSAEFEPVFAVYKDGALQPDTVRGPEPLTLVFDMCASRGPYKLGFGVDVDGVQLGTSCRSSITFKSSGAGDVTSLGASSVRRSESAGRSFSVRMWVRSVAPNNDPKASRRLTVEVGSADPCSGDSAGPVVSLVKPKAGEQYPSPNPYPVRFEASADDATTGNNGISLVEFKASSPTSAVLATVTSGPPWTFNWEASAINGYLNGACNKDVTVRAYAVDRCGNSTFSDPVTIKLNVSTVCDVGSGSRPSAPTSQLLTRLAVPGGAGQVILNGEASFPRSGRSTLAARPAPGENRVEATLVEGRSPGTWAFELGTIPGLVPASLRVVAGEAVQVTGDAVVFRLQGRPGERVVFSFEVE